MSGSGDIGGEVSGEEAAWRDLIARFDTPVTDRATSVPWPAREDLSDAGPITSELPEVPAEPGHGDLPAVTSDPGQPKPPAVRDETNLHDLPRGPQPGRRATDGFVPFDRTRVIRPAGDPRSYSPAEEEDERYVPMPLPPPARLDAISKAAWTGLICGPGYLLLGTLIGWTISGTEALLAVAAFVAGFVVLVLKMGNKPPRDDNDDGAVL